MVVETGERRDVWGRLESLSKILGGVGAIIASIGIPLVIQSTTEQSRRAQVYMQVMSEREKSDTTIRQEMFKTLLDKYLGTFNDKDQSIEAFRKRIQFLSLLSLNFQEYLDAKPLFEDIHFRLEQAKENHKASAGTLKELQHDLVKVAKNVSAGQTIALSKIGINRPFQVTKGERVCIRLYTVANLSEIHPDKTTGFLERSKNGSCNDLSSVDPAAMTMGTGFPSVEVELMEVRDYAVTVRVRPYQEFFKDQVLKFVIQGAGIEFEVSYFDTPYLDNTRLFDNSRFALVLERVDREAQYADLNALIFTEEFMSLRDRPYFEEMLRKMRGGQL